MNNILSCLWLLLLMMITACSDEGREMAEIHQGIQESDEVELSICTQIPEMEIGSRAVTERITAITAFAFSDDSVLIKKVDATPTTSSDTTGRLKIKVPKRTRSIHFVAKNNASYDAGNYTLGETTLDELLLNKTTTDLHYWGMLTFANAEALNVDNLSLTLYRNMAKVVLTSKVDEENDYIAGFLNYNGNATLIPRDNSGNLAYQANAVTLPEDKGTTSHESPLISDTEYLLSEHANEEGNRLYAICCIGRKFYKIAFSNSNGVFFPLVRNHLYRIVINQISGGSDSYDAAKIADPINGSVREETMNVTNVSLTSYKGNASQITVTIPNGVTSLKVTTLPEQFVISSTEVTLTDNVCDVTGKQSVNFTLTLKDDYIGTTGTPNISFSGSGTSINATGTANVTLNGFMDMYEMYVDNNNLNGSTEYAQFFHTRTNTNVNNKSLTTEYVDAGVNGSTLAHNHNTAAINMVNESAITFTIADTRYLTLLVARNGNAPSIDLQTDGNAWTKTSDDAQVSPTYNFSKDGDITTSGRLIRYELPAGTYTLQRGNNDYLLYYMRVTTDKPIMTDIAQPLVTDYELAWSGGEFQDDKAKGYFKIDETNSKHIVNEDKLTHTVTLKSDGNSLNTSLYLNLTAFELNKIDLNVATTRVTFERTDNNNYSENDTTQHITAHTNSCDIPKYNAGTYTLSSTIGNPKYKYEIFYDSLKLKSVEYEVKSPIMPALYNSMDGSKLTPVKEFTSQDEAWAIGFKMPMVVPTDPTSLIANYKGYTIDINIRDWSKSTAISSGLGVIGGDDGNYQLGTQKDSNDKEMIHPREGWTYKIALASIAGNSIVPSLKNGNKGSDTDHYFTYGGTIAKAVTIPVTYTENPLNISLDFYVNNADGGNGQYSNNNIQFGETQFYLKATIPSGVTPGSRIELDMSLSDGRTGIHETDSRDAEYSNGISYRYDDGTVNGLVINTVKDQTEYWICWKYVRSDGGATNDVSLNYTISSKTHTLSGETSANITIKGNGQASGNELDITLNFSSDGYDDANNSFENLTLGTSRVRLTATISQEDAQAFKGKTIYLKGVYPSINGANGGYAIHWVNSRQNNSTINYSSPDFNGLGLEFNIDSNNPLTTYFIEWIFKNSTNNYNGGEIGFNYTISSNDYNVIGETTATIAFTNEPVFSYSFDNNKMDGITTNNAPNSSVSIENGTLKLYNDSLRTNDYDVQMYIDKSYEAGSYTLTYKVRGDVNANVDGQNYNYTQQAFQVIDGYSNASEFYNYNFTTDWTECSHTFTVDKNCDRFLINLGKHTGNIYIDDLKLVKIN